MGDFMYCKMCGKENKDGSHFCKGCGTCLDVESSAQPKTYPQQHVQPVQTQPTVVCIKEKNQIPLEYNPISAWGYFGYQLLFSLPIAGFICLIVCSFNSNINLRNFARSYWCIYVIILIAVLVFGGLTGSLILGLE